MIVAAILTGAIQSALDPAGEHAEKIARLWSVFLWVTAIVYVLVMIALVVALIRRRAAPPPTDATATTAVSVATGATVLILFGLLIASIFTGRGIAGVPQKMMQIKVTGHQWWWQVEYEEADRSKQITSANEITIPVGVAVNIRLQSPDVIHSLWVPNLAGKRDLIPGHDGSMVIKADRPGVFRGQCAEFCGEQHAKMSLWVNALPAADYAKWAEAERMPSKIPSTAEERKGEEVFLNSPCPLCHSILGTEASGKNGPDLTHFASRRSIAAATLPNRRGDLGAWITDPQHIKPGNQMPPMLLAKGDLDPLITYLESLK
jgi:cytochrome c oxidase subunit 2